MAEVRIRPVRGDAEYPRLVEIWRSAVDATHDFLADEHRDEIERRLASGYLPPMNAIVAEVDGIAVGFAATADGRLEMLFVHADSRGRGVGTTLLDHVVRSHGVTAVDVNEQNPRALGFYEHHGFTVVGRSERDAAGWPYPLLYMEMTR